MVRGQPGVHGGSVRGFLKSGSKKGLKKDVWCLKLPKQPKLDSPFQNITIILKNCLRHRRIKFAVAYISNGFVLVYAQLFIAFIAFLLSKWKIIQINGNIRNLSTVSTYHLFLKNVNILYYIMLTYSVVLKSSKIEEQARSTK